MGAFLGAVLGSVLDALPDAVAVAAGVLGAEIVGHMLPRGWCSGCCFGRTNKTK